MKHFYIITNEHKDCGHKITNQIRQYLEVRQVKCSIQAAERERKSGYTDAGCIPEDVDCILVLGGDGTLLQAARDTIERDIPLLGINLGTLGYLAEVEVAGMEEALHQLLKGNYEVEQRMMLTGRIIRADQEEQKGMEQSLALNDIVITRSGSLQIIRFQIWVNGQFLREYHADGVILSTPTGSTGYNLSAGGPIVEPKAELMLVTPVCPHTMNSRSVILAPEDKVEIRIGAGREGSIQQVEVDFDGSCKLSLYTGDRVEIQRAVMTAKIVKINKVSFLELLHKKMSD
ncbi:MAG: NAD(+)/NADH kinase [Lachnospiraceae bacterium]|nr:NAD(+)/NADH kinase [Lachnospiraceae bacterium]